MVSSAKLSKAERGAKNYVPYAQKLQEVVASIANSSTDVSHPMLTNREVKKTGYLVITSDKGLVGAYNSHVLKALHDKIKKRHASRDEYTIIALGRKGYEYFKKREIPVLKSVIGLPDQPVFSDIKQLTEETVNLFVDEEIDELYLFYNHFESAISQKVTENKLLPIENLNAAESKVMEYEYEPNQETILNVLLPQYAESLIFGTLLDAKAAEHAASMTAMKNATDNANELIDDLDLQYNRARQAAITQEITEIVGGAAALE